MLAMSNIAAWLQVLSIVGGIALAAVLARSLEPPPAATSTVATSTVAIGDAPSTSQPHLVLWSIQPGEWRRTERGWESTDNWYPATTPSGGLHPLVLGSLELLLSLGSLTALCWDGRWSSLTKTPTPLRLIRSSAR